MITSCRQKVRHGKWYQTYKYTNNKYMHKIPIKVISNMAKGKLASIKA